MNSRASGNAISTLSYWRLSIPVAAVATVVPCLISKNNGLPPFLLTKMEASLRADSSADIGGDLIAILMLTKSKTCKVEREDRNRSDSSHHYLQSLTPNSYS